MNNEPAREMKGGDEKGGPHGATRFVSLFSANERRLRSYVFGLVPNREDVDEIMQDVSLVLWKKFDQYEPGTEFIRWAYAVARYEVLMFRRRRARDRHVFDDSLLELLASEYEDDEEALSAEREALAHCLDEMSSTQRNLLMAVYAAGMKINRFAESQGISVTRLYKRLNRLRSSLLHCIETRVNTTA